MKRFMLVLAVLGLQATVSSAQIPDTFENLQVLPKDIGKQELIGTMRSFSAALGLRCDGCHEQKVPGDFESTDWASDAKPRKEVARGMMRMVSEINQTLLPTATGEHDFAVRCITCHRGVQTPEQLGDLLLHVIADEGVDAGVARYRELREEYYGSGSYDFGPLTLPGVADALARDHDDADGARRMLQLNLEMIPDHADSYLMLARLDLAAEDPDAARANVQKALQLDPENRRAQRMLQELGQ